MSVAFRAASGTTYETSSTEVSETIPAATEVGDLILVCLMHRSAITAETGWTLSDATEEFDRGSGTTQQTSIYEKIAEAGDVGSEITWTQASAERFGINIVVISGGASIETLQTATRTDQLAGGEAMPMAELSAYEDGIAVTAASRILAESSGDTDVIASTGWNQTTSESESDNRLGVAYLSHETSETTSGEFSTSVDGSDASGSVTVLVSDGGGFVPAEGARVTQASVLALADGTSDARVTQAAILVLTDYQLPEAPTHCPRYVEEVDLELDDKTRRFVLGDALRQTHTPVIASLRDVSIQPPRIGSATGNETALGERGAVTVRLADHDHPDGGKGTYWTRLRAAQPFYMGRTLKVRKGADTDLRERSYLIESIKGVGGEAVTITAKDPLKLLDKDRAVCPKASSGKIAAGSDIADTDTTPIEIDLTPSGVGDEYPGSGKVAIGGEIFTFERSGDTMTLNERSRNRVTESHDEDDTVQIVESFLSARVDDILETLLKDFSPIADSMVDASKPGWTSEVDNHIPQLYTADIAVPTPVDRLIGELALQAGFGIAWDDVNEKIIIVAIQPPPEDANEIDDTVIVADSIEIADRPDKRISQVWTSYGQIDPCKDLDEPANYRSTLVTVDSDAESDSEYGQPKIKRIFSRWIPQFGGSNAESLNDRLLASFRNIPRDVVLSLPYWKVDDVALGESRTLKTRRITDADGNTEGVFIRILSLTERQDLVQVSAEELAGLPGGGDRTLVIDSDTNNVNMRDLHDSLFAPATDGINVILRVNSGVVVGSDSTSNPAVEVGDWDSGVNLFIENNGRITGAGGLGGDGGPGTGNRDGADGQDGGTALYTRESVTLTNNGTIAGGGGGGGGGGGAEAEDSGDTASAGGGGAGGGAGRDAGSGGEGAASSGTETAAPGQDGDDGTVTAGGDGGAGGAASSPDSNPTAIAEGGDGGSAGDPGQSGSAGQAGQVTGGSTVGTGSGGSGGDPGVAIDGHSNVDYDSGGTIIGSQVN